MRIFKYTIPVSLILYMATLSTEQGLSLRDLTPIFFGLAAWAVVMSRDCHRPEQANDAPAGFRPR